MADFAYSFPRHAEYDRAIITNCAHGQFSSRGVFSVTSAAEAIKLHYFVLDLARLPHLHQSRLSLGYTRFYFTPWLGTAAQWTAAYPSNPIRREVGNSPSTTNSDPPPPPQTNVHQNIIPQGGDWVSPLPSSAANDAYDLEFCLGEDDFSDDGRDTHVSENMRGFFAPVSAPPPQSHGRPPSSEGHELPINQRPLVRDDIAMPSPVHQQSRPSPPSSNATDIAAAMAAAMTPFLQMQTKLLQSVIASKTAPAPAPAPAPASY